MVLGKKVAIFNWEWGRNLATRDGPKTPPYFTSPSSDELLTLYLFHLKSISHCIVKVNQRCGHHL